MAMPALFLAHGGGPLPILRHPSHESLTAHLASLPSTIPTPRAILVISAHWEESKPTVTSASHPDLMYDYHGFPPESYTIKWPAPGNPALASRVCSLLKKADFQPEEDGRRGFDHGVFVPLTLAYPDASIPTVALSLLSSLDPQDHVNVGKALQPLRDEGVLIVGSGLGFHNMGAFNMSLAGGTAVDARSKAWDEWLTTVLTSSETSAAEREAALLGWLLGPHARYAHPREEHLLPLFVVAGAAGCTAGQTIWSDVLLGAQTSSFMFSD